MTSLKTTQNFNHSLRTSSFRSHRLKSGETDHEENIKGNIRPMSQKNVRLINNSASTNIKAVFLPGTPTEAESANVSVVKKNDSTPDKPQSRIRESSGMTLQEMEEKILSKATIILHDSILYFYNGKCYQIIEDGEALLELIRAKISYNAFASVSLKRFSDLFIYMRADKTLTPHKYQEKIRQAIHYISFQNGILDLNEMMLYPHSPKYLTFYSLDACWTDKPSPKYFRQFLQTISAGDSQIICRIKESLGYLLSPINEGKYFFVMGNAQNSGKSTLGIFLQNVLGQKLVTTKSVQQLSERFSLGNIQGKLLNLSMDLPKGKLNASTVSIIKQITGGDTVTVEKKYDKQREVAHCRMRFLFASNYPVTLPQSDDNDAFWDRMIVIPFLYSIKRTDTDVNFLDKLLQEKDDIISSCIISLGKVIQNHYIFSPCPIAEQLKQSWRYQEYDSSRGISAFVEQCLEITGNSADKIYLQTLYQHYHFFCDKCDLPVVNYNSFSAWLSSNIDGCFKKRIHKTGTNPQAGFIGLRFKSTVEQ